MVRSNIGHVMLEFDHDSRSVGTMVKQQSAVRWATIPGVGRWVVPSKTKVGAWAQQRRGKVKIFHKSIARKQYNEDGQCRQAIGSYQYQV